MNCEPIRRVRFFANLGPGLISGAADDDPSGISTYAVAGATFGYAPLWTALFTFPLIAAVQIMCARLGMVTGRGLAGVVRRRYPRWILWGACVLLVLANVINIGADLGGMGEVTQMVTGVSAFAWTPFFAFAIIALLFRLSYHRIARIFKWLTLVLFAYVITAFLAHADWRAVWKATFFPHMEWSRGYLSVFVGILGTTISPYLFFWQAAQEVEEERAMRRTLAQRKGATDEELRACAEDVITGMFFSNLIMYFIILTTAATLHSHAQTQIGTAREAAEALRPLAGEASYWLFALGLIGTGMLGVPVLAGSCAYAVSEAAAWRGSLEQKPRGAKRFYMVIATATVLGLALNLAHLNAIKMLFWSAVINGVLAPPLILLVVLLTSDPRVMGPRVNPRLLRYAGWITFVVMTAAAAGMLVAPIVCTATRHLAPAPVEGLRPASTSSERAEEQNPKNHASFHEVNPKTETRRKDALCNEWRRRNGEDGVASRWSASEPSQKTRRELRALPHRPRGVPAGYSSIGLLASRVRPPLHRQRHYKIGPFQNCGLSSIII